MGKAAALLALTALIAQPALAEPLRISGTGSSAPLVTALFEEFRKQHPDAELLQPTPPLGSSGALKALAGGRIDLALPGGPQARRGRPDRATFRAGDDAAGPRLGGRPEEERLHAG
jgi:hypothetical protein